MIAADLVLEALGLDKEPTELFFETETYNIAADGREKEIRRQAGVLFCDPLLPGTIFIGGGGNTIGGFASKVTVSDDLKRPLYNIESAKLTQTWPRGRPNSSPYNVTLLISSKKIS